MLVRVSGPAPGPPGDSWSGIGSPRRLMSSTGTTTWSSSALRTPASTIVTGRCGPGPGSSPGPDRPPRKGAPPHSGPRAQRLARSGRQEQVEGLRRGDEDVGRMVREARPLTGRRVARADADLDVRAALAARPRGEGDALQRRAEIAVHVGDERPRRRDAQDPP